jgi:hypothetical protein
MQMDKNGASHIISTASLALNATERKYTTREQALLSVTYALQKFQTYTHPVIRAQLVPKFLLVGGNS